MPCFVKKIDPDLLEMVEGEFEETADVSSTESVVVLFGGERGMEVVSPEDAPFSSVPIDPSSHYGVLADNRLVFDTPSRDERDEWLRKHWKIYRKKTIDRCRVLPDGRIAVKREGRPIRGYDTMMGRLSSIRTS